MACKIVQITEWGARLDEIGMTNHNNYDVAVLLQFPPGRGAGAIRDCGPKVTLSRSHFWGICLMSLLSPGNGRMAGATPGLHCG
jgi:hypothetical protein